MESYDSNGWKTEVYLVEEKGQVGSAYLPLLLIKKNNNPFSFVLFKHDTSISCQEDLEFSFTSPKDILGRPPDKSA